MISSQYGREFDHADYGKLKKVYTIWICAAPPKKLQNRIIGYAIKPYVIEGDADDGNDEHDLLRCIIIYLGEESNTKNKLLRLLEVLLSGSKDYTEKKRVLDEYEIETTSKFNEEVMAMCNLSDGIWNNGYNEGVERGIAQGMERGAIKGRLEMIKNLMHSLGFSAEKAMETLRIPKSEWGTYLPILAN